MKKSLEAMQKILNDTIEPVQAVVQCPECSHVHQIAVTVAKNPIKRKKVEFTPWVFESGNFQVNVTGEDGGTNIEPDLYPAFDLEDQDGMTDWCVRQNLKGGDSVPIAEVYNGAAQDILTGIRVNGHKMSEADADSMQHAFAGYLAALKIGTIAVPFANKLPPHELAAQISYSRYELVQVDFSQAMGKDSIA